MCYQGRPQVAVQQAPPQAAAPDALNREAQWRLPNWVTGKPEHLQEQLGGSRPGSSAGSATQSPARHVGINLLDEVVS